MTPYKNRKINWYTPVAVYRNLNKGGWSIKQGNLVVAHAETVTLENVVFRISEAGRIRCVTQGKRNVHAYALGDLAMSYARWKWNWMSYPIRYNPFHHSTFMVEKSPLEEEPVYSASAVYFGKNGVCLAAEPHSRKEQWMK